MYEMLGNHSFMIRNYTRAAEMLGQALLKDPKNKAMRRKLIVCYTQIGQPRRALEMFLSLIKEDIDFVINTDPIADDCPCPDLVYKIEHKLPAENASPDDLLTLGILYLYCDLDKSLAYFQQAVRHLPDDPMITTAVTFIQLRAEAGKVAVSSRSELSDN